VLCYIPYHHGIYIPKGGRRVGRLRIDCTTLSLFIVLITKIAQRKLPIFFSHPNIIT